MREEGFQWLHCFVFGMSEKKPVSLTNSPIRTVLFGGNNFVWLKERYRELRGSFFGQFDPLASQDVVAGTVFTAGRYWLNEFI